VRTTAMTFQRMVQHINHQMRTRSLGATHDLIDMNDL
jgi:hypothetical protein